MLSRLFYHQFNIISTWLMMRGIIYRSNTLFDRSLRTSFIYQCLFSLFLLLDWYLYLLFSLISTLHLNYFYLLFFFFFLILWLIWNKNILHSKNYYLYFWWNNLTQGKKNVSFKMSKIILNVQTSKEFFFPGKKKPSKSFFTIVIIPNMEIKFLRKM